MDLVGQAGPHLASEDVIISAPMSYAGSAQRIMRLRRQARSDSGLRWLTALAVLLVAITWVLVTVWYLMWGFWLVPYRLLRRGTRKRRAEALRHRELLAAIQAGGATGSPNASAPLAPPPPSERIGDLDRERVIEELRSHMLAGRLDAEEFEQRLAAAHAARTQGEILALRSDLPDAGSSALR